MFSTALIILPVFLIILAGFIARKAGVVDDRATQGVNRFVIWIALPALMFDVVATTDWKAVWNPGFVAVSMVGSFIVFGLGKLVRIGRAHIADAALDGLNASYANAAYIGFPLMALCFGASSRPFVAIASTLTLMSLFATTTIVIELARHAGHHPAKAAAKAVAGTLRNPVLAAPLLGLLWWLTGCRLPDPIKHFADLLGGAASPAALAAIGMFLAGRPLGSALQHPAVLALSFIKLIVHPAVTALLAIPLFHLPRDVAVMAITIAALPTGTGAFMAADLSGRDSEVTSGTVLLTTVLSVLTVSLTLAWLGHSPQ